MMEEQERQQVNEEINEDEETQVSYLITFILLR